jgi:asparagine synthase (glutamine-hydrolysing)
MKLINGNFNLATSLKNECKVQWDGCLHNREELIKILGLEKPLNISDLSNHSNHSNLSDSEILIKSYKLWGTRCVEKFKGDFAFALIDREKQMLFCGRDPLGIKPFHYMLISDSIYYSSNVTDLARNKLYHRRPSEESIAFLLVDICPDHDRTHYEGISKLSPGHLLVFNKQGVNIRRYYEFQPKSFIHYSTDEEYGDHYRHLFKEAVRNRMPQASPVGIMLSGGLDSASVTGIAHEILKENQTSENSGLETFTAYFKDPKGDDQGMVEKVLSLGQWKHHSFYPDRELEKSDMDFNPSYEDLYYGPNGYFFKPMLARAREQGISKVFFGLGADDTLTPAYSYFADLLKQKRFLDLYQEIKNRDDMEMSGIETALRFALKPLFSRNLVNFARKNFLLRNAPSWINNNFIKKYDVLNREASKIDQAKSKFNDFSRTSRYFRIFESGNYSWTFEQYALLGSLHDIEYSFPLMDLALVEYAFQIPCEQLTWKGLTKRVLRSAAKGIIPDEVRNKKKFQTYDTFCVDSLRRQQPLFDGLLKDSILIEKGFVDEENLKKIWESLFSGDNVGMLIRIVNLEKWLRTF